jgi:hypothetical protein
MSKEIKKDIRGGGTDSVLSDMYDRLRDAHYIIKELYRSKRWEELPSHVQISIESLHNSLYMAEYIVCTEDNKIKEEDDE